MVDITLTCPECGKTSDHGKIQLNLYEGTMKVECGWCHCAWTLGVPVVSSPVVVAGSRRDYMPHWKRELLGVN